jgi:hypothetical protein
MQQQEENSKNTTVEAMKTEENSKNNITNLANLKILDELKKISNTSTANNITTFSMPQMTALPTADYEKLVDDKEKALKENEEYRVKLQNLLSESFVKFYNFYNHRKQKNNRTNALTK